MTTNSVPAMLDAVRNGLRDIGYQDELILPSYTFRDILSDATTSGSPVRNIELAAFAQAPASYRSACFGVTAPPDSSPNSILPFRSLGAPQVLALHPNDGYIERWKIVASGRPQSLGLIPFDEIADTFQRNRAEWEPQRFLRAKSISFRSEAAQLDFFDLGLIPTLEAALRAKLDRELHNILARCKEVYTERHTDVEFLAASNALFRLIFRLVAAKMLIDRGDKPEWLGLDAQTVIQRVEEFYFSSEQPQEALQDRPVQNAAWQQVREGLNLQNLSVETLAYLLTLRGQSMVVAAGQAALNCCSCWKALASAA
jgi:hypothetical protein